MSTIGENASVMCVCVVISDWTATAFALWKIQEACSTCSTRVALQYEGIFVLSYEDRYFRTFVLQRCTNESTVQLQYSTFKSTTYFRTFVNIFYLRSKVQLRVHVRCTVRCTFVLYTYTYCTVFYFRKYESTKVQRCTFVLSYKVLTCTHSIYVVALQ
jgi:hypothetical protein